MEDKTIPPDIRKKSLPSRIFYDTLSGKDYERHLLEAFLGRMHLMPAKLTNRERPDFDITLTGGAKSCKVDCEVTLFYSDNKSWSGSLSKRFTENWKIFARYLMERLTSEGNGLQHIFGAVFFKEPSMKVMDNIDQNMLINELVRVAREFIPAQSASITEFEADRFPLLRQIVEKIYLENLSPSEGILWWPADLQTGVIPDPRRALLRIIRDKNKKAASYKWSAAAERWLVVVAEARCLTDVAILGSTHLRSLRVVGSVPFTRIYLWDRFLDTITELFPSPRIVFSTTEDGKGALIADRLPDEVKVLIDFF